MAKSLRDNPAFQAVLERLKQNALDTFIQSVPGPGLTEVRELAHLQFKAVEELETQIQAMADQVAISRATRPERA